MESGWILSGAVVESVFAEQYSSMAMCYAADHFDSEYWMWTRVEYLCCAADCCGQPELTWALAYRDEFARPLAESPVTCWAASN